MAITAEAAPQSRQRAVETEAPTSDRADALAAENWRFWAYCCFAEPKRQES